MLIRFKKPDPRAGAVARMDSSRGQHFVDTGVAERVEESALAEATPATANPVPATKTTPPKKAPRTTGAKG